jgi:hypothetical protein
MRMASAATADIRRQLRRVRWGRNLYAAQVALFGGIAALAATATGLLLLALRATPATFAVGFCAAVVGLGTALVLIGRRTRHLWVRRRDAPTWIDVTAGLGGRLTTLLALDGRDARLLPVLRAQNEERRARWTPERLIESPFPPGAIGAATLAGLALLGVLMAAPSLRPPPPQLIEGGAGSGTTPITGLDAVVERLLATGGPTPGGEPSPDIDGVRGVTGSDGDTALARLPTALQASIRRRLWGERFANASAIGRQADARSGDRQTTRAPAAVPGGDSGGRETNADVRPGDDADASPPSPERGGAASGAGTGSDPNVLGAEMDETTADGHFALGLAARVFGRHAETDPPSGAPPPRDSDSHPALAARQRPAEPFHTTAVPPAYRPIVRTLFAHGRPGGPR